MTPLDVYFHMANHYKKLRSVKSVVDTSSPAGYQDSSRSRSRPSSRINKHSKPTGISSSTQLSARLTSLSSSSYYETQGVRNSTSRSKSVPLRPPSRRSTSVMSNPKEFNVREFAIDNANLEIDNQTPVAAPRTKKGDHIRCSRKSDHLYMQFMLRITEDIIQNDLYSAEEMQQVFKNHIEANCSRLNRTKMLQQIEILCNELNVRLDGANIQTDFSPKKDVVGQLISRCTCNKAAKTSTMHECECDSVRSPPIECGVHKETNQLHAPVQNDNFVCSQQGYIEAVFYENGINDECDSEFVENEKFKNVTDTPQSHYEKICKPPSLGCVTEKTEPTTSTETIKCDAFTCKDYFKNKESQSKISETDINNKDNHFEIITTKSEFLSDCSSKACKMDNKIKQTGTKSSPWHHNGPTITVPFGPNNEEIEFVLISGPLYAPKTKIFPFKTISQHKETECVVFPQAYVQMDILENVSTNSNESIDVLFSKEKGSDSITFLSTMGKIDNESIQSLKSNLTNLDDISTNLKPKMVTKNIRLISDHLFLASTNDSFELLKNNKAAKDEEYNNCVSVKNNAENLVYQRDSTTATDTLLLSDEYKIDTDVPYKLPGLSEAVQNHFPSRSIQTEMVESKLSCDIDWNLLSKDTTNNNYNTNVDDYANRISNIEIFVKTESFGSKSNFTADSEIVSLNSVAKYENDITPKLNKKKFVKIHKKEQYNTSVSRDEKIKMKKQLKPDSDDSSSSLDDKPLKLKQITKERNYLTNGVKQHVMENYDNEFEERNISDTLQYITITQESNNKREMDVETETKDTTCCGVRKVKKKLPKRFLKPVQKFVPPIISTVSEDELLQIMKEEDTMKANNEMSKHHHIKKKARHFIMKENDSEGTVIVNILNPQVTADEFIGENDLHKRVDTRNT